jgi:NRPS condensation-like uncharacterized protein
MPDRLPLTHFEELMLYQDCEAYPCSCFMQLQLSGELKRSAFEAAARIAVERHPLLRATVEMERGRPRWKIANLSTPNIFWNETNSDSPQAGRLELEHEAGLRLIVRVGSETSEVLIQFHHACCDGQGMLQYIHDLLVAYANEADAESSCVELPSLDPELLRGRGSLGLSSWKLLKMAPKQAIGLQGVAQFVMRKPQPILPHERFDSADSSPAIFPAWNLHQFDEDTSNQIRSTAKRLAVTTNDLLARDLFLALREYRMTNAIGNDREWLRMMVPISLRTASHRRVSASNIVSSVFLDRRGHEIEDADRLLTSIHDEMELIKRLDLKYTFNFSLYANRFVPGGLRKTAAGHACNASVVFSNLGKILTRTSLPQSDGRLVAANVRLDNVLIAAPIAPYMTASFVAHWYANRLSITLHHDVRLIPESAAKQLLGMFVDRVTQR